MNNKTTQTIIHGDCLEVMKGMPDKSFDLVLTDPPYDFTEEQKEELQSQFLRVAHEVIVFSPPENEHPYEKPTSLLKRLVNNHSKPTDRTLDPFMGSGTTLVAAKALNRNATGIEISEEYCKIAQDRLDAMPTP